MTLQFCNFHTSFLALRNVFTTLLSKTAFLDFYSDLTSSTMCPKTYRFKAVKQKTQFRRHICYIFSIIISISKHMLCYSESDRVQQEVSRNRRQLGKPFQFTSLPCSKHSYTEAKFSKFFLVKNARSEKMAILKPIKIRE